MKERRGAAVRNMLVVAVLWGVMASQVAHLEESPVSFNLAASTDSAMFRWWLPAGEVDDRVIDAQLKAVAAGGFKGVELCIHMGDSRYPRERMRTNGWGTPRWNALYERILTRANELQLQVDTTISPAWPAAVPTLKPDSVGVSKELRAGYTEMFSGRFQGPVPVSRDFPSNRMPPPPGAPDPGGELPAIGPNGIVNELLPPDSNPEQLVAVTAARIIGEAQIEKSLMVAWGDMPHVPRTESKRATLLDPNSMVRIDDYFQDPVSGEYRVNFTAPDNGRWLIFGFWMRGTAQQNKEGAATAERNYVIDHLSKAGSQALIEFWNANLLNPRIRSLLRDNGGALFEDSLELEYDGLVWTPDLLSAFEKQRGYDLVPFLPLLIGNRVNGLAEDQLNLFETTTARGVVSDQGDRIRRDFREILTSLYIKNHIEPLQRFAQSLGLTYRAQSYGLGMDIVRAAAAIDGPDGESLGFGPGPQGDDRFRMIAGGASLGGRRIVADEVGAIANEGYRLTWRDMLSRVDRNIAAGANQMIFHGMAYPDSSVSRWPGVSPFGFGLAGYWGARNPDWQHIDALSAYLGVVQQAMQSGVAKRDLAVLKSQYGTRSPALADQTLADIGYSYHILTPASLLGVASVVDNGTLFPAGPAYRALVVLQSSVMSVDTATLLLRLAREGMTIVVVGDLPMMTPFLTVYPDDDTRLAGLVAQLNELPNVQRVDSEAGIAGAMRTSGIEPALAYRESYPLRHAHRRVGQSDVFFVHNTSDSSVDAFIRHDRGSAVRRVDPWTGVVESLAADEQGWLSLPMAAGEALLLEVDARAEVAASAATPVAGVNTDSMALTDWSLRVESWEEEADTPLSSDTRKTTIELGSVELQSWRTLPGLGDAISGLGYYASRVDISHADVGRRARLKLGSIGESSSVVVRVNGQRVLTNLYTLDAEIGNRLLAGSNLIEVEVASTLGNRLIHDGAITPPPWEPNARVDYEDYGLLGPVSIEFETAVSTSESSRALSAAWSLTANP